MFSSAGVIFIVLLLVVGAIVLSLAVSYELQFYACKNHRNPWCFDDWMCHAPSDPSDLQVLNNKIRARGGTALTAGVPYPIVETLFKPTITRCTTANISNSDVSYFMVDPNPSIYGPGGSTVPCRAPTTPGGVSPDGPTCQPVPNGCLVPKSTGGLGPPDFTHVWVGLTPETSIPPPTSVTMTGNANFLM